MAKALDREHERNRDVSRKRAASKDSKDVVIGQLTTEQREWRALLEADIYEWLRYFGNEEFTREFTPLQVEMITAITNAITNGGDQAIAAPRGEGKTSVTEWVVMYAVLTGLVKFVVIFSATGSDAEEVLASIKERFETNERLQEYYPESCVPIAALENTPNRAHYQTVSGHRFDNGEAFEKLPSKFSWCGREIVMPNVPGSPSAKSIIATRGLDAAVRGMKRGAMRPQLAIIDDPDTIETASSEEQAEKLEKKIDRGIAGLSGQKKRLARVMLTTLQNKRCVSAKFTDPQIKPSWHGRRFRFLETAPTAQEKWDEYIVLKSADWQQGTNNAHEYYVAHRAEMDAGAKLGNPFRRGDAKELSALQFYFNEVARLGIDAVNTEYNNDPPEESGPIESGITPHRIQRQLSGYHRKIVPPDCVAITQGIDVRKVALHWVVRAWRADGSGFVIDYGVHEVFGTIYGSDEGVDVAIKRAILSHMDNIKTFNYTTTTGETKHIDLTLVDAGWQTQAVYAACAEHGAGLMPSMGFGKSSGCVQANFTDIQHRTQDKKPGDGWFLSKKGKIWLVCMDTDRWKRYEHERWMTSPESPGSLHMYGVLNPNPQRLSDDEKSHHSYARHICNEVESEEFIKGKLVRKFKAKSDNTHWLDASYMSCVASNMKGVRIGMASVAKPVKEIPSQATSGTIAPAKERPTARELMERAKRRA